MALYFAGMRYCFALLTLFLFFSSCEREPQQDPRADPGPYSELYPIVADLYKNHKGQPYSYTWTTELNGKQDSGYTSFVDIDWAPIINAWKAVDINQPKFYGRYRSSEFTDMTLLTRTVTYEALDEKLFTRTLTLITDLETGRFLSIFAATRQSSFWGTREQKLYFAPEGAVLLQEDATSRIGPDKSMRIEYRYMRDEES